MENSKRLFAKRDVRNMNTTRKKIDDNLLIIQAIYLEIGQQPKMIAIVPTEISRVCTVRNVECFFLCWWRFLRVLFHLYEVFLRRFISTEISLIRTGITFFLVVRLKLLDKEISGSNMYNNKNVNMKKKNLFTPFIYA